MGIKLDFLKKANRGIILQTLKKNNFTRVELQKYTKLAAGTLSNLVKELVQDGVILETNIETTNLKGRKGKLISVNFDYKCVIGIKINRDTIIGSLNSLSGDLISSMTFNLTSKNIDDVITQIINIYNILKENRKILGIGITIPAQIDPLNGIIKYSSHFKWENIPFVEILSNHITHPIFIENDVRAMTLAESEFLSNDNKNLLYINVDSGVSAGIILNNSLFLGDNFIAGQIGHTFIENNGKKCICGKNGCLETIASIPSILREYALQKGIKEENISLKEFLEQISESDEVAEKVFLHAISALSIAISNISNTFNISNLIIGGEILKAQDFLPKLKQSLETFALPYVYKNMTIKKSHFNHKNNTVGAIYVVLNKFFAGDIL